MSAGKFIEDEEIKRDIIRLLTQMIQIVNMKSDEHPDVRRRWFAIYLNDVAIYTKGDIGKEDK